MTKAQKIEQLKNDREKVKNGIRFAVHANAIALDYGIYKPYYKTRKAAEKAIRRYKASDRRHGWIMFYEVRELHRHEQWFNDLKAGDRFENIKDNKCLVRQEVHLANVKCGADSFSIGETNVREQELKRKGLEFYRYREEFTGWKLGVRLAVKR